MGLPFHPFVGVVVLTTSSVRSRSTYPHPHSWQGLYKFPFLFIIDIAYDTRMWVETRDLFALFFFKISQSTSEAIQRVGGRF